MIPRYARPQMTELWGDEAKYRLWLEIETLALEAMVEEGLAPPSALKSVRSKGAFSVPRILEIEAEVKHDVIAFLTNVGEHVGADARYLHLGMTSSDLLDTAFAVQLCRAADLLLADMQELLIAVKRRALEHKLTPCIGRSHGIHAEPITFGLKAASWYAELSRQCKRLAHAREDIAVGAISGPVGTFASVSPRVEAHVCRSLALRPDAVSTQVISRDRHAQLFLACAQLGSTVERIAVEIRHLQRTEVREVEEFFSRGQKGSSAMPHKRNPILSENLTGLSRLLRAWAGASLENVALWHERDISHSSVERVIAPDIMITLDFMLSRLTGLIGNLVVYPANMRRNLDLTGGLIFSGSVLVALTAKGLSREAAYGIVQQHALAAWGALNDGVSTPTFRERLSADPEVQRYLSAEELEGTFSLAPHFAHVDEIFSRVFGEEVA
jgi:adenylosuccinate lyase